MSEGMLLVVWIAKFLTIGLTAVFYRLGGWFQKLLRRIGANLIYFGASVGIALWKGVFNPWMLISLPLAIATLYLGYSNRKGTGWIKRLMIALAMTVSFLNYPFIFHTWKLYPYHAIFCFIAASWGIFNPFKSAVEEEANIAVVYYFMPIMMI